MKDPLGEVDASKKKIEEILKDNVEINSSFGQMSKEQMLHLVAVVGKKGSGKTHLLSIIEKIARDEGKTVIRSNFSDDFLSGEQIRSLTGSLKLEDRIAIWRKVWSVSVSISVITHFTARTAEKKKKNIIKDYIGNFYDDGSYDDMVDQYLECFIDDTQIFKEWRPQSPIQVAEYIINKLRNYNSLRNYLERIRIQDMRAEAERLSNYSGGFHIIIDGLDEVAHSDPRSWLPIQLALYRFCFDKRLLRDIGGSLHSVISLRTYVYAFSKKDLHSDRREDGLVHLDMDYETALRFMRKRLLSASGLDFAHSSNLTGDNPLGNWLGFSECHALNRGEMETVERYFLRHTRLAPREIISSFNELANRQNFLFKESRVLSEEEFKGIVASTARVVAVQMIKTASEEAMAHLDGQLKLGMNLSGFELDEFYIQSMVDLLRSVFNSLATEVFERDALISKIKQQLEDRFDVTTESELNKSAETLLSVLWRSELIAYSLSTGGKSDWRFWWSPGERTGVEPPPGADLFGFHSAIIDELGVQSTQLGPIFVREKENE